MRRSHYSFREVIKTVPRNTSWLIAEAALFGLFCREYVGHKNHLFSQFFEGNKNNIVKGILIKRGKSNRIFLHMSVLSILTIGVIISPMLSDSNPFSKNKNSYTFAQEVATTPETLQSDDVFQTHTNNTRTKIISYTVQAGDTISTIAKKFDLSEDTIRWENNLTGDAITVGDQLQILPVTGIAHKVQSGDTIYSIAKKYNIDAQPIADFPGNDFVNPQTFSLVAGEIVIVPGGVKPEEQVSPQYIKTQYLAQTPPDTGAASVGGFVWPTHGTMNQYVSWYHTGIDIGIHEGTPLVAAQTGVVEGAYPSGWNSGYGTYIIIHGDNGYSTLYGHMSALNVGVGQRVVAGKTLIGWSGNTGHSTGPHLHFEVRSSSGNVNPLSYLP